MKIDRGEPVRGVLSVLALCWTGLGLLLALQVVLPAPTFALWYLTVLAKEYGLLLAAFASFGLVLAALAGLSRARKAAIIAATMGVTAILLSLVPTTQAWRTASAEDAPLSPSEQFAGLSSAPERSPETVTYASPDGEQLRLDVWEPPGETEASEPQGRPAVVVVHGGGWHRGKRSQTPLWDEWLAGQGYVIFDIDYRLSPPPRWQDAPGDVKCAVGWVKENADRYGVDPERVALVGYSAGGHLALLSAYTEGNGQLPPSCDVEDAGVSAVAAFYPPTDLRRLYEMERPWARPNFVGLRATRLFLGGTLPTAPERYRIASPTVQATPGDPPTLLIHGGADRVVQVEQSRLLAARLHQAGVPYRLLELPWANHSFDHATRLSWRGSGAHISRAALGEFLERRLGSPEDPASRRDDATSSN